jgi:GTP-binding protein
VNFAASAPLKGRPTSDVGRGFSPAGSARIALVVHVLDARHPGLVADVHARDWLQSIGIERATVANKIDKLSRAERAKNLRELERTFGMAALPVSAADGEGLDDLWRLIAKLSRQQP